MRQLTFHPGCVYSNTSVFFTCQNTVKTIASLFSGGGGVEVGAIAADLKPIWGIENDPTVASVYAANVGHQPLVKSVGEVDPFQLEPPDVLWASPPCQAYSTARNGNLLPRGDADIGLAVIPFLEILLPPTFILENVEGYRKSKVFSKIVEALYRLGYWVNWEVLNAADFGVPQTRRRLILRAVKNGFVPPLPPVQKWRGWYNALADLIPGLEAGKLAPWQLKRLPPRLLDSFLLDSKNADPNGKPTTKACSEPAFTIVASISKSLPKAVLIEGTGARNKGLNLRAAQQPAWTIKCSITTDGRGGNRNAFIHALVEGQVRKLNTRSLARLQSFPDWYTLPESTALAGKIVGNAVPPLMVQRLLEAFR